MGMSIAFIVWGFPILSETFILNQITGLIDRGHNVDIYALDGRSASTKVHPDVHKYNLLQRTTYAPKIPANYAERAMKGLLLTAHLPKDPSVFLRSLNVMRGGMQSVSLRLLYTAVPLLGRGRYDIVHCQFGTTGLQGQLLRSIGALNGRLVVTFRGLDISQHVKQFGHTVYNELFAGGDFFLTNCEYFRRRLIELGCEEQKLLVHASGIDCRRFAFAARCPQPDGSIRLVTVGRLVEKKGIEYSIRAVAKVVAIHSNITYHVIGEGPLRSDLEQLVHRLGVNHVVKLLGPKDQQEIIEILNNSHISIAPSVTAQDGDQDAPVNTLKEAMAMGLPVIATRHGGIPELVEDGVSGFLVPDRDADAIAERLRYLIEHPEVWPRMGQAGRSYVESHYDIEKLNNELVDIYERLLGEPRIRPIEPHNVARLA
jgi:colanic acid/amylovoran biosynthesis glycosyltransferase